MDLRAGQKVRVTLEGIPCDVKFTSGRTYVTVKGSWGSLVINTQGPDVTVEAIPFERPTWWESALPGTVVETGFNSHKRAVKRDFRGTCAPADAQTHPWMWADGTPATEDDILAWGPFRLLSPGRG